MSNRSWKRRVVRWDRYAAHYPGFRVRVGWNPELNRGGHGDLVRLHMRDLLRRIDLHGYAER